MIEMNVGKACSRLNHGFQEWMSRVGIITRTDSALDERPYLKGIHGQHRSEPILDLLDSSYGYIVPAALLIYQIYGRVGESEMNTIRSRITYINNIYKENNLGTGIYWARNIGWALGVEKMVLQASGLPLVHRLYKEFDQVVPTEILSRYLYGNEGQAAAVRDLVYRSRQRISPTTARIASPRTDDVMENGFKLTEVGLLAA